MGSLLLRQTICGCGIDKAAILSATDCLPGVVCGTYPEGGMRGHGGRVVTLSTTTSEAGVLFPPWPQVGKLLVACRWSAVYSTEP